MDYNEELQSSLHEISLAPPLDQRRSYDGSHVPVNRTALNSSFFSGGFFPYGGAPSPFSAPAPANEAMYGMPTPSSSDPLPANADDIPPDELDLSRYFRRLHIEDEHKEYALDSTSQINQPGGMGFGSRSSNGIGYNGGGSILINDTRVPSLAVQEEYNVVDSTESYLYHIPSDGYYYNCCYPTNQRNQPEDVRTEKSRSGRNLGIQIRSPWENEGFHGRDEHGIVSNGGRSTLDHFYSSHCGRSDQSLHAFSYRDGYIIQGNSLNVAVDRHCNGSKDKKNRPSSSEIGFGHGGSPSGYHSKVMQSVLSMKGHNTYLLAKDQQGCRHLQNLLGGGVHDVQFIFEETIHYIADLMVDPFGNYLVQKLLSVCNEEQKTEIVLTVTQLPGDLVKISLNNHGTRVVQKLISSLSTRQQISLVRSALEPGFLHLAKDLNGNHVLQHCLQYLSAQDNEFIYDAAAKYCVELATHQHGCCVLNRCVSHSTGGKRAKLVARICGHGLLLAQHPYGNYVVQHVIEQKIPMGIAILATQFKGSYATLSTQKFSSHVIEKCLNCFEDEKQRIVEELLHFPRFEHLIQHQYANYVIQAALDFTKGALRASLVEAISPYKFLSTNPHCKKIFSLLKK